MGFSQNQRGEVVTHDIAHQLTSGGGKPGQGYPAIVGSLRVAPGMEGGRRDKLPVTVASTVQAAGHTGGWRPDAEGAAGGHLQMGTDVADDPLLPLGLDSHRYRCCGNGVVAPVASWLGTRLAWLAAQLPDEVVLERI
jgi:hypothetical protein